MKVKIVGKQTAMNPVARAVAQAKLRSALLDQKIKLYLMESKESCTELMEGLGATLGLIGYAADIQRLQGSDLSILHGGLSACTQLINTDKYDLLQTVAITNALDAAERLNRKASAQNMNRAVSAMKLTGVNI